MAIAHERLDCAFDSRGFRCAGWFYRPVAGDPAAVVVMAHGFGAQRSFGLVPIAEGFADAGYAVLLFDHRYLGDSEGEPRGLVDPFRQLDDWRAAIRFARSRTFVDTSRVVLWGTSFSGGHVISVAAEDRDLSAIIAQAPFVDPISTARLIGPLGVLRMMFAAGRDQIGSLIGLSPFCIPVHGPRGSTACLATEDSHEGFLSLVDDPQWPNRCPARSAFAFARYRPLWRAHEVTCPALVVLAERDTLIAPSVVERAARKIPRGELERVDVGHFDVYHGIVRERLLAGQIAFLDRHVAETDVGTARRHAA